MLSPREIIIQDVPETSSSIFISWLLFIWRHIKIKCLYGLYKPFSSKQNVPHTLVWSYTKFHHLFIKIIYICLNKFGEGLILNCKWKWNIVLIIIYKFTKLSYLKNNLKFPLMNCRIRLRNDTVNEYKNVFVMFACANDCVWSVRHISAVVSAQLLEKAVIFSEL